MLRGGELSWEEQQRRERLEPEADLYSIIYTVEALEKAYVRDSISADDYTDLCRKLIGQFKTLEHMIGGISVVEFMDRHQLACPAARHRLLEIGVPATVEYMRGRESGTGNLKTAVADTVQLFITAMDALKLGMVAVDQIQPLLNDLLAAITKIPDLPSDFQAKEKTRLWLTVLHKMTASETLSDAQVRQCLFDLETGYNEFHRSLST
jgi:ESCRT-I complex subunit VPS28